MRPLLLALIVLVAAGSASGSDGGVARLGLDIAVKQGRLAREDAGRYRTILNRTVRTARVLPDAQAQELRAVLRDVSARWRSYDRPRARALFEMLGLNRRHLAVAQLPPARTDVIGPDGVLYRSFPGHGLQFHPLGSFGRLSALIDGGRKRPAWRLARALLQRGRSNGGTLVWEYYFDFGGGTAPWTSGMAQAVAAEAFARLGLRAAARRAVRAIPSGLLLDTPAGPWIRLYQFSGTVVLNAQLQAVLSLRRYARLARDPEARRLADDLLATANALFPRFDTGCWSRYALDGAPATAHYHRYVVRLMWRLAHRLGRPNWASRAVRFRAFDRRPVLFLGEAPPPLFPLPVDGYLDTGSYAVWLSKCASVTITVGKRTETHWLRRGMNRIEWQPGGTPGRYPVRVSAVDEAGRSAERTAPPLVVRRDREPPRVRVRLDRSALEWQARDAGTPWLRIALRLSKGGRAQLLPLGRRELEGEAALRLPAGRHYATVVARDSSGNRTEVPLGGIGAWPHVARYAVIGEPVAR